MDVLAYSRDPSARQPMLEKLEALQSNALTQSLDWVHREQGNGGLGYYLRGFTSILQYPVVEVWFIACIPHHPFVSAWFSEFDAVCKRYKNDGKAYLDKLRIEHPTEYKNIVQNIPESLTGYLTLNVIAQKLMQVDGVKPYRVLPADDGPFKLLIESGWDSVQYALSIACEPMKYRERVIKLRGCDRAAVEEVIKKKCYMLAPSSIYNIYLRQ